MKFIRTHEKRFSYGGGKGHVFRQGHPGKKVTVQGLKQLSQDAPYIVAKACSSSRIMCQEASPFLDDKPE